LWIQRLPITGEANLAAQSVAREEDRMGENEDYNRIATLAASLKAEEILSLDADTVLHRLFWEEKLLQFEPLHPKFACACSHERVSQMIRTLGQEEAQSILQERGDIDVGCDFCGKHYRLDAIDVTQLFHGQQQSPGSASLQ
jgi:molecular chaperone Hsp33